MVQERMGEKEIIYTICFVLFTINNLAERFPTRLERVNGMKNQMQVVAKMKRTIRQSLKDGLMPAEICDFIYIHFHIVNHHFFLDHHKYRSIYTYIFPSLVTST